MFRGINIVRGGIYDRGIQHGGNARELIDINLKRFWTGIETSGFSNDDILRAAESQKGVLGLNTLKEIAGIAAGAGRSFADLLAFNLFHSLILPEECTVYMAVGSASATGDTVFGKNSDKVGGISLVGDRFYKNKEINVILISEAEDGSRIIGVSAAGATGLKLGMNSKGVAAGTNIGRTKELKAKKMDLTQLRAIDRAQIIRDGLEFGTALPAAQQAAAKLIESPTATPGTVEFADAREAYIIESSYDRIAVKKVVDDIDSRSNCFVLLKELNQEDDLSSICRYIRTQELLKAKKGQVTVDDLKAISMDHAHGPGPDSICRHDSRVEEETSLAAGVIEINGKNPEKSKISLALGKPCQAWREAEGHITLTMDFKLEDIPEGFITGEVFKKYYIEEARNE
jgi:hypothetical protein